jgi:hypothetical protein
MAFLQFVEPSHGRAAARDQIVTHVSRGEPIPPMSSASPAEVRAASRSEPAAPRLCQKPAIARAVFESTSSVAAVERIAVGPVVPPPTDKRGVDIPPLPPAKDFFDPPRAVDGATPPKPTTSSSPPLPTDTQTKPVEPAPIAHVQPVELILPRPEKTEASAQVAMTTEPQPAPTTGLPINETAIQGAQEITLATAAATDSVRGKVRNKISLAAIQSGLRVDAKGLHLDLSSVTRLLDGTTLDAAKGMTIYGNMHAGPYPFEANETDYAYKRFRQSTTIANGKTTKPLALAKFFVAKYNSERWTNFGRVTVRLELFLAREGADTSLGVYDTFIAFEKDSGGMRQLPWIVEGPFISCVTSDAPENAVIHLKTNEPADVAVYLDDGRRFSSRSTSDYHEIGISGLRAGQRYAYRVKVGELMSRPHQFRAAPKRGEGSVTFAYCGDSREGVGGGMHTYMGMNNAILERHAARCYQRGADFFLMGGDLINGYTLSQEDFEAQFHAWKQTMSGFWHERPVFCAMGNHEALLRVMEVGEGRVSLDAWPYESASAEAVFADSFVNPANGPEPSDSRRPPYRESVFSFHYGPVKVIAFNNNYWFSSRAQELGGSPEGYIMEDQLKWIVAEIEAAEQDDAVKCVVLFAQEPIFPCGGHIADAMWYHGNNKIRAHTNVDGKLQPSPDGILQMRNRLARAAGASSKVAAILCSDEHAYYRVLIDNTVPVGDPEKDDKNGDDILAWQGGETASPLTDLKHAVWYITCGGGGAPYYAEELTPWTHHWNNSNDPKRGFHYSSQENVLLFKASGDGLSVDAVNPYGETIDRIENLMSVK